jgi:hypothetical protein
MTGQVKEDLISRLGEMGVAIEAGRLGFHRHLVSGNEFLTQPSRFDFYDMDGCPCTLDLDTGTMAFTTCQVPVVAHRAGPQKIEVTRPDGSRQTMEALCLDEQTSAAIFERTGAVRRLDVFYGFEADT